VREMDEENEFRLLKSGKNRQNRYVKGIQDEGVDYYRPPSYRPDYVQSDEDPYVRDENGRPVDLLKKAPAKRPGRKTVGDTGLKRYLILGGVFAGLLALSGQLLPAALVAASTFILAVVARWRS